MFFAFAMIRQTPDVELVRRFKAGDREAFTEIATRYQDRVYSTALRWVGQPQVAQELTQDVLVALYRSLGDFRGESKLSTWIFRVVVNHCRNRRVYQRRRRESDHESLDDRRDDDGPVRELPHPTAHTDAGTHQTEAEAVLNAALAALDDDQRQIIVLRDLNDLAYEEIAEILDIPRGTVKSRLHRARAELAQHLQQRVGAADIW